MDAAANAACGRKARAGADSASRSPRAFRISRDRTKSSDDLGCLNEPKAITVIKESEEGFDQLLLPELRQTLSTQVAREFEDRVYFRDVYPRPKGREVMLEIADVIASGMRRRLTSAGLRGKDVIAEAVMNVTGFEDARKVGALYRTFMP